MTGTGAHVPDTQAHATVVVSPPVRYCLPRSARLTSPQYRAVFDAGRSIAGRYIVIWSKPAEGTARRVGVVTSKRALHTAVERNRARRLMREAFRLNQHTLRDGVDLILIARARIVDAGGRAVAEDFLAVCRRVGLCRKESGPC
jgi:ribonuclease P protein component